MTRATVVIPTHDHGPTLRLSIPSALDQTVEDLEVFVIGDGVPDVTREIVEELRAHDERIRFFDNPKGPRHGEVHRHAALREATGEIVCYLSDDDLWLPDHVETVLELLAGADFAHTLPIRILPNGSLDGWVGDLAIPSFREGIQRGINFIPLPCAAHTLEAYRRLPHGWRTTPDGTHTDLYMWQQWLELPDVRAVSGTKPTLLHLPSSERVGTGQADRVSELERWDRRMRDPAWRAGFAAQVLDLVARQRAAVTADAGARAADIDRLNAHIQQLDRDRAAVRAAFEGRVRELEEGRGKLHEEIDWLRGVIQERDRELEEARAAGSAAEAELKAVKSTRAWRLRERLLRTPGAGRLLRWAGGARARRPDR